MSKGLKALEEIKTCKLIDHVQVKEGLFSNKLLSYERRYGKDVFSKQIPIIEKELKELEERREMMRRFNEACVPMVLDNETEKKLKALEIIKNIGILKPYETIGGQCWLETMCDATKITKENYDLLKEVIYGLPTKQV